MKPSSAQVDSTSKEPKLPHKRSSDTLALVENDSADIQRKVSPKKAAILSAVLPGAGQIYNRKYWKLPIVYGALGTTAFLFFNNRYWYQEYREAYINDLDEENPPSTYALENISTGQLREAADASRKNMEYAMIGFALCYALQIVDATVDAHLFYFDVSDDLSMHWEPSLLVQQNSAPIQGVSLNFRF